MEKQETCPIYGPDLEEILEGREVDVPDFKVSENFEIRSITGEYKVMTQYDEKRKMYDLRTWKICEGEEFGSPVTGLWICNIPSKDRAIKYHFGILDYLEQSRHAREIEEDYIY